MARAKKGIDYTAEINKLKIQGPERLYIICGEEDYLRECFITELKNYCLGDGVDDFNYTRLDGKLAGLNEISEAINSMPFMSDRMFVELRDFDINACKDDDQQKLKEMLEDIPDYCTVVFVQDISYSIDGRLSMIKTLKKLGSYMEFSAQDQNAMVRWIGRRFVGLGKDISKQDAEYLMFSCGVLMNQLIPEIEKLANYVTKKQVTKEDIDKVAIKLITSSVFEMTDKLTMRDFDGAVKILNDLINEKESPIKLIAIISMQYRRLYAAKLASEKGRDAAATLCSVCDIKQSFIAEKLIKSARRIELDKLVFAVTLCTEYDHKMKSTGLDDVQLIHELFIRLAVGE